MYILLYYVVTCFSSKIFDLKIGFDLGVPLEETWSCASNSTIHCGWCDPCKNRQKAFKDNGITDNTLYENVNSKNSSVNV
ncbi:7-cyano-7-deazaguanine synthase [Bacillus glycinifermentans]|uniref:7-cyano-7-deazaguanine synthase n=1 Tax=Bacillus glycinifermentans TaxID=1664069 RepID=UPI00398B0F8F